MATTEDKLIQKFAALRGGTTTRRADFKGYDRRRLFVLISSELALNLQVLKYATGEDKNSLVDRLLKDAVGRALNDVERKYAPEEWKAVVACAKGAWKQKPLG